MAQNRGRKAAQKAPNLSEEQGQQGAPIRRPSRGKPGQKPSPRPPVPVQRTGRKRAVENIEDSVPQPSPKRSRISRPSAAKTIGNAVAGSNNPIDFWRKEGRWPRQFSEPDMEHLLARKRSLSTLGGRKRSNSASSTTPSDQKPREEKSAQYRDQRYETLLATKGSFMVESPRDVTDATKEAVRSMLQKPQPVPQEDSLFRDGIFKATCQKIHNRNEARVIQDISRLIVPSAESLATCGSEHLEILTESVNEGWNNSIPLTGTRPQPDYSVGFQRDAFSEEQLEKLAPFIGEFLGGDVSFFMATYYMYFPFLTCEVKCGAAALDIADRQNAHSMTLAARGIVELFRLVGREEEVHRQILAFSISHDHQSARIYGYYPVIDGKDTKYYRYPIRNFSFTELDGKEKWAAYRFTKNVYDTWMPDHFTRICSAIDQLPSKVEFDVPALSDSTGLSQALENLAPSEADSASLLANEDVIATPDTSFSKPGPAKKRKSPVKSR